MTDTAQLGCDTLPDMTPEQEQAVAAQDASTDEYGHAAQAKEDASERSIADALASLRLGVPPTVVEKHSPFTGSYIRKLARDAGIKGDPRYDRTIGR
jgi:hypothetical protein